MISTKVISVVLILSGLLAACGGAANDPVGVTKDAMQAMMDKDFNKLGELTCAAKKANVQNLINPAGALGSAGIDPNNMLNALTIRLTNAEFTKVSESGDKAVVQVKGTLSIKLDKEKAKAIMMEGAKAANSQGQFGTPPALMDPIIDALAVLIEQDRKFDNKIDVVKEGGRWKVCGSLLPGGN